MTADDEQANVHEPVEESMTASAEAPEAAELQQSEERPVIDVHAPHGGIHTWKDFWIHLGTIALGLLIAIGLEQTVEWMHHLHQRHKLEDDLRDEATRNRSAALKDEIVYDKQIVWLLDLLQGVAQTRATQGKAGFVYPARPDGIPDSPRYVAYYVLDTEVWTTAKESDLIGLLPRLNAEIHDRLYIQIDQVQETRQRVRDLGTAQGAFETRFAHGTYPPQIDISKLTPQQLDEYEKLLSDELEGVRVANSRLKIYVTADDYILSGGMDEAELRNAIMKANTPQ